MSRTLRFLAAISFAWILGFFALTVIGAGREPLGVSYTTYQFVGSLGGELVLGVGILALVASASHRQIAWFALFALLIALLHVLPSFIFQPPAGFLTLFEAPPELLGRAAWVMLLPALIPGAAFVYTSVVGSGRHSVAEKTRPVAEGL